MLVLDADGTSLGIRGVLFGELGFSARFACPDRWDGGPQSWLFDAREFTYERMSLARLGFRLVERSALFGDAGGLHRDRPGGRLMAA